MTELPDWLSSLHLPKFIDEATGELESLARFRHVATFAFSVDAKLVELLTALKTRFPDVEDAFAVLMTEANEHQPFVQAEVESGMSYLGSLLVVRLVTIIETCVSDALVWALQSRTEVLKREEIRRLKGPLVDFAAASESERAEFLANAVAQETRAPLKIGVGKYEALLEVIGLAGNVDETGRRLILELLEVRNVIVHKNGRADTKLVERCPWLHATVGEHLTISQTMMARYAHAASYYLLEIIGRWIRLEGRDANAIPYFAKLYSNAIRNMTAEAQE